MKIFNIAFIIPSYNESENIIPLIKKIKKYLPKAKIIIVDDPNSVEKIKIKKLLSRFLRN